MISRRTALKSLGLAVGPVVPAITAASSVEPTGNSGVTRAEFPFSLDGGPKGHLPFGVRVWIGSSEEWAQHPGSTSPDSEWQPQVLDSGQIMAVDIAFDDPNEVREFYNQGNDEPFPEHAATLRRIRAAVIDVLDELPCVTSVNVETFGDGQASLMLSIDDGVIRGGRIPAPPAYATLAFATRDKDGRW